MTRLLEKGKVFKWTQNCQEGFEELKKCLTTTLVFILPDLSKCLIYIAMFQGEALAVC
jgi:hypothetical protein